MVASEFFYLLDKTVESCISYQYAKVSNFTFFWGLFYKYETHPEIERGKMAAKNTFK